MPTIRIEPQGQTLTAQKGSILRDALRRAGILLDYPCGGKGSCRQCRVAVSPAPPGGKGKLSEAQSAGGIRLACQLAIDEDCTVTIPEERLSARVWSAGIRDQDIHVQVVSSITRTRVSVAEPSLEDQRPDWERLADALAKKSLQAGGPDARTLERMSIMLRTHSWSADALCEEDELLWLVGRDDGRATGFAIDLGTTTVDMALLDLETGGVLGRRAFLNRQVAFGADVISRAQSFHEDRGPIRDAVLSTIDDGARQILSETGESPEKVLKTVAVGNPIMMHILHGIDPWQLTRLPYVAVTSQWPRRDPRELGLAFQEHGYVETLPLISAYVGADTVGMILALGLDTEKATTLSIDIGTNGEMVLASGGSLLATSTAAGPAFEGAQISCGMRALPGAVVAAAFGAGGDVRLQTVGDAAPQGICGTGLVSAVAQLLEREIVDETGRLRDPSEIPAPALGSRIFSQNGEPAFALSEDRRVYITQKDIRTLQLAKGAVRTGIDTLLDLTNIPADELDALRLAGNFGAGLDAAAAMRIGLIPPMDLAKVDVVGNAALRGAVMALLSREQSRKAANAARGARFIELGAKPEFQTRFMEAMLF
ncbi:MAG TPA: ASKHA domain-containing protein [Spirochaetia bacterium]|nr:ASKHA domain-containing protein [Spirochaetia bacterium]